MPDLDVYNDNVELNVLSILVQNPIRMSEVFDSLKEDMFSGTIHQIIMKGLRSLYESHHENIAPDLLVTHLELKKQIDKIGGPEYIYMLANNRVNEKGFDLYYKSLVDNYKGRMLLQLAGKIPVSVKNSQDMNEVVASIKSSLDGLDSSGLMNGIHSLDDLLKSAWDNIEHDRIEGKHMRGISSGFKSLDDITGGIAEGQEWMIGARPSMGKSATLLSMLLSVTSQEIPALLINREMMNQDIIERLLSMGTGIDYLKIRTRTLNDEEVKILQRQLKKLRKLPLYIDSNFYGDAGYVSGVIRKHIRIHGIRVVGIDYIQLLAERGSDQTAELGRISRGLKLLAEDQKISIIVLSQLNRLLEGREEKRPILSDLRQSGNLEEDADVVLGLYRDEMYNKNPQTEGVLEFIMLKQRNGPSNKIIPMRFNGECVKITDERSGEKFNFGEIDA